MVDLIGKMHTQQVELRMLSAGEYIARQFHSPILVGFDEVPLTRDRLRALSATGLADQPAKAVYVMDALSDLMLGVMTVLETESITEPWCLDLAYPNVAVSRLSLLN